MAQVVGIPNTHVGGMEGVPVSCLLTWSVKTFVGGSEPVDGDSLLSALSDGRKRKNVKAKIGNLELLSRKKWPEKGQAAVPCKAPGPRCRLTCRRSLL